MGSWQLTHTPACFKCDGALTRTHEELQAQQVKDHKQGFCSHRPVPAWPKPHGAETLGHTCWESKLGTRRALSRALRALYRHPEAQWALSANIMGCCAPLSKASDSGSAGVDKPAAHPDAPRWFLQRVVPTSQGDAEKHQPQFRHT